ncbi:DNA-directed RNA polymerase subunit beta [candidate division WOR-3 bacterium]|nr:DNA-directed RNA polymerase subunit beta [candidate division WOR-3 bacterium]
MKQKDFSKAGSYLEIPNLLSLQLDSFFDFVQHEVEPSKRVPRGLEGVFRETFPIEDEHKNFRLEYIGYTFGQPKYSPDEAVAKGVNYSMPLRVVFRMVKKGFGKDADKVRDIVEQEVYFCDLPWMTQSAAFIINGVERVVVSQLHRSPGVYFSRDGAEFSALLVPLRGAWFELVVDKHDAMVVLLDRKRRISAATFMRAIGYTHEELIARLYKTEERKLAIGRVIAKDVAGPDGETFARAGDPVNEGLLEFLSAKGVTSAVVVAGDPPGLKIVSNTLAADRSTSKEDAIKRIYYRLRAIAPHSVEMAETVILGMLFDPRRFDLGAVGRYKLNQRLMVRVPPSETGLTRDDVLSIVDRLLRFADDGRLYFVRYICGSAEERDGALADLKRHGRAPDSHHWYDRRGELELTYCEEADGREAERLLQKSGHRVVGESIRYQADDVDHLASRRVKRVGELLENQFRAALMQLAQNIRERAAFIDDSLLIPQELVNTRVVANAIMQFFTQSQLCQFMEQTNPLTELTHKRRVSTLGPGGLTKETAGFEVRDVHYSHYGRVCPIETPEGPNIGLISTVSSYAQVDQYGFVTTPYWRVKDGKVVVGKGREVFLNPDEEDRYAIAQATSELTPEHTFARSEVICRRRGDVVTIAPDQVDFMDVSPKQLFAPSTVMIPFLEHDDADRALMGANMQRQAVPLLLPEKPLVATGVEGKFAVESGAVLTAEDDGVVTRVDSRTITVRTEKGLVEYRLRKYRKSNQYTCLSQRPVVRAGDAVKRGDLLADGPGTQHGQVALGRNILVAFVPWRGYNYEDAIIVSEKVLDEDAFTSIQILEFEIQARETRLGPEEITRDIPGATEDELRHLDEFGVIGLGAEVGPGDILVGRITPKGETEFTPEERLLRAIFGEKAANVRDTSLRVEPGVSGVVVERRILSRKLNDAMVRRLEKERVAEASHRYELKKQFFAERRVEKVRGVLRGQKAAANAKDGRGRILHKAGLPMGDEFLNSPEFSSVHNVEQLVSNQRLQMELRAAQAEYDDALVTAEQERKQETERVSRGDELPHGVLKWITIFIAQKRRLAVGDKMAGRHGNKGVVAKVLSVEDMPYVSLAADSTTDTATVRSMRGLPVDMVLNPLGVPSRMNLGQVLETHLGWAAHVLGYQAICPVFQSATPEQIKAELKEAGLPEDGKLTLYDGRTGEAFHGRVMVGMIYMMKLVHMVDDKIHARSTGRYSLITQQPLGGKAQFGGQRFGEMEVWALEAYGAAHALQEMLTIKSDDVEGRSALYESLMRGKNPPRPRAPASFAVLVKELQGLGLELIPERGKEGG